MQKTSTQPSTRLTAVLAESDAPLRDVLQSALDSHNLNAITALDANECLAMAANADIVLLDLMLDGMDGLSLLEALRTEQPSVPLIAFIGQKSIDSLDLDAEALQVLAIKSGANAVFIAPFNLAELLTTTDRLCEQQLIGEC